MALNSTQRRYLRGLAHGLKPIVIVGHHGTTPAVLAELDAALRRHELVKVKINFGGDSDRRDEAVQDLCTGTNAELAHRIGHVAVLYRPAPEHPTITLPRSRRCARHPASKS